MVAEPVQATLETLSYFYRKSSDFLSSLQEKLFEGNSLDKLTSLYPFDIANDDSLVSITRGRSQTSWLSRCFDQKWKSLTILTIGLGTVGSIWYYHKNYGSQSISSRTHKQNHSSVNTRRVPKLSNGARRDIVLVVGSPTEPLTRLIALDFEKRGFIVYLTILDEKDFKYVESNPITDDINYLNLNDTLSYESQLSKFQQLLELPVIPFPGACLLYTSRCV